MIREVNILDYLPPFIQEYPEIERIMKVEEPEIQTLEDTTEQIKNDMFIRYTDESGITRYEKMLGIVALDDDKLEDRQAKVLSIYNNNVIYTYRSLIERLKVLCGEGNFTISLIPNEYKLHVGLGLASKKMLKVLDTMLQGTVPANIDWSVSLLYNTHEVLAQFTHEELAQHTYEQLREDAM